MIAYCKLQGKDAGQLVTMPVTPATNLNLIPYCLLHEEFYLAAAFATYYSSGAGYSYTQYWMGNATYIVSTDTTIESDIKDPMTTVNGSNVPYGYSTLVRLPIGKDGDNYIFDKNEHAEHARTILMFKKRGTTTIAPSDIPERFKPNSRLTSLDDCLCILFDQHGTVPNTTHIIVSDQISNHLTEFEIEYLLDHTYTWIWNATDNKDICDDFRSFQLSFCTGTSSSLSLTFTYDSESNSYSVTHSPNVYASRKYMWYPHTTTAIDYSEELRKINDKIDELSDEIDIRSRFFITR